MIMQRLLRLSVLVPAILGEVTVPNPSVDNLDSER